MMGGVSDAGWARSSSEAEERAASGREGRRVGEGQRRADDAVDAPAAVACMRQWGKEMLLCFYLDWRSCVILKMESRRSDGLIVGRPGNEPSERNTHGQRVPTYYRITKHPTMYPHVD
jgi:hypothetical protein